MKKICYTTALFSLLVFFVSCSQEETQPKREIASRPTVPVTTSEVLIGDQIWMTKNLNVSRYRNGDIIPQVQDPTAWANLTTGAWCYYENNTANEIVYGKLYNWYAVTDPRGLAPAGWHIPIASEFTNMINALGGSNAAGGALKATGNAYWSGPNVGATNASGFTGLPGGNLFSSAGGIFNGLNAAGFFWTSNGLDGDLALANGMYISSTFAGATIGNYAKKDGLSVRCVKDETVTDIDGNSYVVVSIGNQKWMKSNLNVSRYRNGDVIPQVQNPVQWQNLTTGAWCYYQNSTANGVTYGKLYNWYAVTDPRGLAPLGWHVASDAEFSSLENYLGGQAIAGGKLKATTGWMPPNLGATNSSGFTALPSGVRDDSGFDGNIGYGTNFWSSTAHTAPYAFGLMLFSNYNYSERVYFPRTFGLSVRCIKD